MSSFYGSGGQVSGDVWGGDDPFENYPQHPNKAEVAAQRAGAVGTGNREGGLNSARSPVLIGDLLGASKRGGWHADARDTSLYGTDFSEEHKQQRYYKSSQAPRCRCKFHNFAVLRTVKRECSVQGKRFWSCATLGAGGCRFFQWVFEDDDQGDGASVPFNSDTTARGKDAGVCFKCLQPGHWANRCPNHPAGARKQDEGGNGQGEFTCFRCKQKGHYSRNCPQIRPS